MMMKWAANTQTWKTKGVEPFIHLFSHIYLLSIIISSLLLSLSHVTLVCVCVCEKRINTVYFFTTNVYWFHRYLLCTCRDFGPCMREPLRVQPDTLHLILSRETLAPFHRLTAHWITLLGWCLCVRARNGNNATAWRKKNIKIKRKYVSCWLHKYVSAAFSSRNIAR